MKKHTFDLTDRAIDCEVLSTLGDPGKEILRALSKICYPAAETHFLIFEDLQEFPFLEYNDERDWFCLARNTTKPTFKITDVLTNEQISAAMEGATLVFNDDVIPEGPKIEYFSDAEKDTRYRSYRVNTGMSVIAYKLQKPNVVITDASYAMSKLILTGVTETMPRIDSTISVCNEEYNITHIELDGDNYKVKMSRKVKEITDLKTYLNEEGCISNVNTLYL